MSVLLRISMIIGAVLLMKVVIRKIYQSKLKVKYSIFWLAFSGVFLIMGIFPQLCRFISGVWEFHEVINMIYFVIIIILIIKLFLLSVQLSGLESKVDSLIQQIVVDMKLDKEKKEKENLMDEEKKKDTDNLTQNGDADD